MCTRDHLARDSCEIITCVKATFALRCHRNQSMALEKAESVRLHNVAFTMIVVWSVCGAGETVSMRKLTSVVLKSSMELASMPGPSPFHVLFRWRTHFDRVNF